MNNATLVTKDLQEAFKSKGFNFSIAATFFSDSFEYSPDVFVPREGLLLRRKKYLSKKSWKYTPLEKYWYCKCYVKFKTPSHVFYESSKEYVEYFERTHWKYFKRLEARNGHKIL